MNESMTGKHAEQTQGAAAQDAEPKVKKEIKFIDNPLPGPKKHVKKEMTYDYDIPADKMFFDNDKPSRNYYDI